MNIFLSTYGKGVILVSVCSDLPKRSRHSNTEKMSEFSAGCLANQSFDCGSKSKGSPICY